MSLMSSVSEVKTAKKRCISMGFHHSWLPHFDQHELAACMDNHTICIDIERTESPVDHYAILYWILVMARKINKYCDESKVIGDPAAQYWLERFLWRCDCTIQWDILKGN